MDGTCLHAGPVTRLLVEVGQLVDGVGMVGALVGPVVEDVSLGCGCVEDSGGEFFHLLLL